MTTFYEVQIDKTCKAIGDSTESGRGFTKYDLDRKEFETIKKVKEFLADEYGKCKRDKIYIDGKNGEAIHIGTIYCFRTPEYNNRDWVIVREMKATTVLV